MIKLFLYYYAQYQCIVGQVRKPCEVVACLQVPKFDTSLLTKDKTNQSEL